MNLPSKYTRVTKTYDKFAIKVGSLIRRGILLYSEKGNIRGKQKLFSDIELTSAQKREIDQLFVENYGRRIPYDWHKLYQSYTGIYRKNYFPEILFTTKLEPLLNLYSTAELLSDKNLLHSLFDDVVYVPKTYFSCVNGRFRDEHNQFLNKTDVVAGIGSLGDCVIKKTVDTSSGRDVIVCSFIDVVDVKIHTSAEDIIDLFGDNFVVQEKISQCSELRKINPSSLNTFRVMTYVLDGTVYNCPTALRVGRGNSDKDNMHAGGIGVGITDQGHLRKYAFSEYGDRYERHPDSSLGFEDYEIPHFDKIIETSKLLHEHMQYLGVLSWDLTLDSNYRVVLIEMNPIRQGAWFPQMVNGEPLFGENTAEILKLIRS